jgi:hypothetical protein
LALVSAACGDGVTGPNDAVAGLAIVNFPEAAHLGVPLTTLPIVELRDKHDHAVPAAGVTVTASISSGSLSGTTTVVTDVRGRARFTDLAVAGEPGLTELRFSCCGLPSAVHALSLSLGEISVERIGPEVITGIAGTTLTPGPSVRVKDERAQPLAGASVKFEFDSGSGRPPELAVTDGQGVAVLPSFSFADLPVVTSLRATHVASGKTVHYDLEATVHGSAYTLDEKFPAVTVGGTATLPKILVTDGGPVAGALVRYRVTAGNGVLSRTEAHTGADGLTEPVTLSTSSRGTTQVEAIAVGYSRYAVASAVAAVVPPVRFEYAGPCDPGCPSSFNFTWPAAGVATWFPDVEFEIRVRDALGSLPSYGLDLTTVPPADYFYTPARIDPQWGPASIPDEVPLMTGTNGVASFVWRLPAAAGTYHFTLSSPMIDTPWTYTATVQ